MSIDILDIISELIGLLLFLLLIPFSIVGGLIFFAALAPLCIIVPGFEEWSGQYWVQIMGMSPFVGLGTVALLLYLW